MPSVVRLPCPPELRARQPSAAAAAESAAAALPLVALEAWVGASPDAVRRLCAATFHAAGCDVLALPPSVAAIWLRPLAAARGRALLEALLPEVAPPRGPRPIVFAVFSGAAKSCHCELLRLLAGEARYAPVAACVCATLLDSVVDFTSSAGVELALKAARAEAGGRRAALLRPLAAAVAGALDFALFERFEASRTAMWDSLRQQVAAPALLVYALDDPLVDAAALRALADALRSRAAADGDPAGIVEAVFERGPHVGCWKAHSQAYNEALSHLLSQAGAAFRARRARARGGEQLSSRL